MPWRSGSIASCGSEPWPPRANFSIIVDGGQRLSGKFSVAQFLLQAARQGFKLRQGHRPQVLLLADGDFRVFPEACGSI